MLPGQRTQGLVLGVSVLENARIPFLASNTLLEKLGCIVDTVHQRLRFVYIGVDVPLVRMYGHYVVSIVHFTTAACKSHVWKQLSTDELWTAPDPEVVFAAPLNTALESDCPYPSRIHAHQRATGMADLMEEFGETGDVTFPPDLAQHVTDDRHGHGTESMAHDVGAAHHCPGRSEHKGTPFPTSTSTVFPSGVSPLRQSNRKVQPVPPVLPEVQVQRRGTGMGSVWRTILTALITVAAAISFQYPVDGQDQGQGQGCYTQNEVQSQAHQSRSTPTTRIRTGTRRTTTGRTYE